MIAINKSTLYKDPKTEFVIRKK
jgi:hypothetical protein